MRCVVHNCKSRSEKGKKLSFFTPRTEEILTAWSEVICCEGEVLNKTDTVCELHFNKSDVEKEYVIKMPDGTLSKLPRGKPNLREGAIPKLLLPETRLPIKRKKPSQDVEECEPLDHDKLLSITDYDTVVANIDTIRLPSVCWFAKALPEFIVWNCWSEDLTQSFQRVVLRPNWTVQIFILNKEINWKTKGVCNMLQIVQLLEEVSQLVACTGTDSGRAEKCAGYIRMKAKNKKGPQAKACVMCTRLRTRAVKNSGRPAAVSKLRAKNQKLRYDCRTVKRQNKRLISKSKKLKEMVENMRLKCAEIQQDAILGALAKLPEKEQLAVKACLAASKLKSTKGMRYTTQWIYECLLLRIKSKKAYNHLRTHKILTLPAVQTLNRYMKSIKGAYGFQRHVFEALKEKTAHMLPQDVRGVLLLDEMKLSKTISFNRNNLQFEGFTDLGKHTPEHQKGKKGDHALVLIFQPFKGKWIQALACFLSKGSASGTVLHKIIIEAVALAEKAGLCIDGVTTDGASWNRSMWNLFGVTEEVVSVEHFVDPSRHLWFFSDFPHLGKALRNFFTKHSKYDMIWTPDGPVSLKHWFAILDVEDPCSYAIKVNFKLRKEHLQPQYYQKMNVALAFQFFGIADVLEIFENRHKDLGDSQGTKAFCTRMKNLITAMNSRTPMTALKPGNAAWQSITSFLDYLDEWKRIATKEGYEFITDNSYHGLKVSLRAALEICNFLIEKYDFKYLMTARLNQDSLERFFGMMRNCCGSNDHPDSNLFIQMYRLTSTYSLCKPPRGCNVSGAEIFNTLLSMKDIESADNWKEQWEAQIDTILDAGRGTENVSYALSLLQDHDYCRSDASDYAISYISGYIARKTSRFARFILQERKPMICDNCISSLVLSNSDRVPERHKLIEIRSKGYLSHPSIKLYELVNVVEKAIQKMVGTGDIDAETLFKITGALEELSPMPLVGCQEHELLLTRRILIFYLTTRMNFICRQSNKNDSKELEMTREKRKSAKLINVPESDVEKSVGLGRITMKRKSRSVNNNKGPVNALP